MEKKLERYMYLYLGCDVVLDGKDIGILTGYSARGIGKDDLMIFYTVQRSEDEDDWAVYNDNEKMLRIKPILRPLNDMSEEELQECGNMIYDFSGDPELNKHEWKQFETMLDPLQFIWLLKRGFDLFGLIEARLAMDRTKITRLLNEKTMENSGPG
jgi:hypothetical protein